MRLFRAFRALFLLTFLTAVWVVGLTTGVIITLVIVFGFSSPEGRQKLEQFRGTMRDLGQEIKKQFVGPGPSDSGQP